MLLSLNRKRRRAVCVRRLVVAVLVLWPVVFLQNCPADEPGAVAGTNAFPSVAEVIGGQTFETGTERDIYFLQAIHDHYASHWSDLLEANITLEDFVLSPEKLLRFVNELGEAMRDRNDTAACSRLALITGDASFYANTDVNRPEIIEAAARALIKIGPNGRKALASAFTRSHYCNDPASLEDLADAIGGEHPADAEFLKALSATAFDFATTNGSIYPHCITTAVTNLLCLSEGVSAVQVHLKTEDVLNNPGRFQAVVDGIAAAHSSQLSTNLVATQEQVRTRLAALANSPGGYTDDLRDLNTRIGKALASFHKSE